MRHDRLRIALAATSALCLTTASHAQETDLRAQAAAIFKPLPKTMTTPDNPVTPEKVALGRMLFFELPPVARRRASLPMEDRLRGDAGRNGLTMPFETRKVIE